MTFKRLANPLLIVGDNPSLPGGLARSGRDIATLCCTLPQFRVAYLGRGSGNRRMLPFTLYTHDLGWGQQEIQSTWADFSGGENGIILTTDDPSRRHWFANPIGSSPELQTFLGDGRNFRKWGYFPLDSTGPDGQRLGFAGRDCLARYDRVLASSEWGRSVMITSGRTDADWLPHGIWPEVFCPGHDTQEATKEAAHWGEWGVIVGCVMANQARKDFPAAFEAFAALRAEYGNAFHAWVHTDSLAQGWNLWALATDYGVSDCLEVSLAASDVELAQRYRACDCTILPSGGEGFGFPIAESMACGTACIVTDYAAGPELVPAECRVRPMAYRVETQHNVLRAVIPGYAFAELAKGQIEEKRRDWEYRSGQLSQMVEHLQWPRLKHLWERWMLEGIR